MSNKELQLYCGNLSEKVTEDILRELFLQAGPLESVIIPKDADGKPRSFAFITFKHAVSVPYTVALMNGISLFGKPLHLDARTGAESEHNQYLEKLNQYKNNLVHQDVVTDRNYNQHEAYGDNNRRFDSRRSESRPETQRIDCSNMRNAYPVPSSIPHDIRPPAVHAPSPKQNQARFHSRRSESRPETQRIDCNMWNAYPVPSSTPYGIRPPTVYAPPPMQNQARFLLNSMPQLAYQHGGYMPWLRNHR